MLVKLEKIKPDAILPLHGSEYSAGYDLHACLDSAVVIPANKTVMIGTGLKIAIPEGYFGGVFARSGIARKNGIRPANCVGVCDSDYRGEYTVALHNDSDEDYTVHNGDRIAQLVVMPFLPVEFEVVDSLDETERGEGGFGSTGV